MTVVRDAVKGRGRDTRWHDTGRPPTSWHACCRWVSVYSAVASALLQSASSLPASCSQRWAVLKSAYAVITVSACNSAGSPVRLQCGWQRAPSCASRCGPATDCCGAWHNISGQMCARCAFVCIITLGQTFCAPEVQLAPTPHCGCACTARCQAGQLDAGAVQRAPRRRHSWLLRLQPRYTLLIVAASGALLHTDCTLTAHTCSNLMHRHGLASPAGLQRLALHHACLPS